MSFLPAQNNRAGHTLAWASLALAVVCLGLFYAWAEAFS